MSGNAEREAPGSGSQPELQSAARPSAVGRKGQGVKPTQRYPHFPQDKMIGLLKISIVAQLRHLPCCLLLVKIKPHLESIERNIPNRISQILAPARGLRDALQQLLGGLLWPVASESRALSGNC